MGSLNLNLFQLLLRNTFHGSSGQLFLGKAVYSTSWQSSSGRVYPVEACSGKAVKAAKGTLCFVSPSSVQPRQFRRPKPRSALFWQITSWQSGYRLSP